MATALSFIHKHYRVVCTVVSSPDGRCRGEAEIFKIIEGLASSRVERRLNIEKSIQETAAMEQISELARRWIDTRS
ncbi:hypothetical protein PCA31118_02708 [Pandoraea captiosa]|uniref:Uncharacterized protein n=1 Tax=Pandoraea captiosa TaxID=2508302 RepID=A0A5E5A467_9BURK|nr:hypothetical protein PCA31118_02708 [Pandoraea captiosa]